MKKKSDMLLTKLIEFSKENKKVLTEWTDLIKKTQEQIFKDYCHKKYLKECEPSYCTYRIEGNCEYPEKIRNLEKKIN